MSFDAERLRQWHVPEIVQSLHREDVAFYALSTGFGHDPLDLDALPFTDPKHEAMRASPSTALILAYPGFWLGDPALGIDAARVLHVNQSIALQGAFPLEGQIVGRTEILDLIDRGQGRGAFLISERRLWHEGRQFARLTQMLLLRSEGGFAAQPGAAPARDKIPDAPPDLRIMLCLPQNAALLYRLNGDFNPLHSDPEVARRAGFARPIMHGMGTFGFVTRLLLPAVCENDPARLGRIAMRFAAPCFPGDQMTLEVWRSGAFSLTAQDGSRIIDDGRFELR